MKVTKTTVFRFELEGGDTSETLYDEIGNLPYYGVPRVVDGVLEVTAVDE